jgi:hypothetical protein
MESYALLFAATLNAGTVLAIAALGLLVNEKAGIVNLGAEGMLLCAALAGFATVVHTGNDWLGFAAGIGAGALLAAIFGVLVIWLNTNQYASGLALSLFGAGFSAFAGNPLLISPQRLVQAGLLSEDELEGPPRFRHKRVDFGPVIEYKKALLEKAFENFKRLSDTTLRTEFRDFCWEADSWLEDYALFRALKDAHGGVAWINWEPQFAHREPTSLAAARESHAPAVPCRCRFRRAAARYCRSAPRGGPGA